MRESVFDPQAQIGNPDLKIIASLERLSEGFRVLLWEKAKILGISPIQIQILIFIRFHSDEKCTVSYLAQEFCLTKPTVSEAVKSLEQKGFIERYTNIMDTRSHTIHLTDTGKSAVARTADFANPMLGSIAGMQPADKGILLEQLLSVVSHLQGVGIISMQRMCFSCRFYQRNNNGHFCGFLNKSLKNHELRLDCGEFESELLQHV
ncbi:MAG TPA: MarR family winged helix-turn-helix transcriptional regulator [Saprospiraceae bacterium]|nr:MarR family winged helix-turn-helix transcriptional regulator [Anaerolineales bacterium]HND87175.1 MarR family winged helix-turn-helix transcriptional regulator [Saprospiraceae bacterium]